MESSGKILKVCKFGHKFYKSSDCKSCPTCEKLRKPNHGFLSLLSAPARRALESKGIKTLTQLSKLSETELLKIHGFGPASIPKIRIALKTKGLTLRK